MKKQSKRIIIRRTISLMLVVLLLLSLTACSNISPVRNNDNEKSVENSGDNTQSSPFALVIEKKANGEKLSETEIQEMVKGFTDESIPDYQMSAMLMAIRLRGMDDEETTQLTLAMMNSGEVLDLSDIPGIKLDKHSTGGVGDTTTLVVAPLVAACGGTIAKVSGRGLGHTGGTLDKLESIPGTKIEQSEDDFKAIIKKIGLCVIGQSEELDPADKKIYAIRDVTATVRSIPLIASSIMSKKLASGSDAIVLDVKTGNGAFMRTKEEAFELAQCMVNIGKLSGREVRAVVTDMNQPLGMAVGNALEVREAVELLSGKIPETDPLYEVSMILASQMLQMGGIAKDEAEARKMLKEKIENGEGLNKLREMIDSMGGDSSYLSLDKIDKLIDVKQTIDVPALKDGYVSSMQVENIGTAAQMLGAGRAKKDDIIDMAVGLVMKVRCGYEVKKGDTLCTLYVNDDKNLEKVIEMIQSSINIEPEMGEMSPLIHGIILPE